MILKQYLKKKWCGEGLDTFRIIERPSHVTNVLIELAARYGTDTVSIQQKLLCGEVEGKCHFYRAAKTA